MLVIEKTTKTPLVYFDNKNGLLEISGRSIPENSIDFYTPLVDELTNHKENNIVVNIKLEYLNTSSLKQVLNLLKTNDDKFLEVNWFYEEDDDDMIDEAENIRSLINSPVNLVKCIFD